MGNASFAARVIKGKRLPGHMGDARATVKNLKVVRVDAERSLVLVRGAVPGAINSLVLVRLSGKGKKGR